jgi:large subunit ribosomal protein L9
MKVVFLEDVEGTAQVGDVKDVKSGFARNFLLPRRLAAPAVEPYLTRAGARAAREAKRQEALDEDASGLAEKLEGTRITIIARVGEQDKLYGSVTSIHIAQEVAKLLGDEEFDHRKVLLPEAIKEVGIQPLRVRLTRNVEATIEIEVIAEGEPEEAVEDQPESSEAEATEAGIEESPAEAELASEEADVTESPEAATDDADAEEAPADEAEAASEEEDETA